MRRRRIVQSSGGRSEEFDRLARDLNSFQDDLDDARHHADIEDMAEEVADELRGAGAIVVPLGSLPPSPGDATRRRRGRGR